MKAIWKHLVAGALLAMLTGSVLATPGGRNFEFEPASLDLGGVEVGQSTTATVLLRSTGDEPLIIDLAYLHWQEPSLALTNDGCSGITLAPGLTCSIDVTFTPIGLGVREDRLRITSNVNVSNPEVEITAEGLPLPTPALNVTPADIAFPPFVVGQLSASYSAFVINVGSTTVTLSDAALHGTGAEHFGLHPAPGVCVAADPLAPGEQCEILVRFQPTAVGDFTAAVRLDSNAPGSPHWVQVSGTGIPSPQSSVAADATALDYGTVFTGQSAAMTLTYTNTGSQVLTIAGYTLGGPDADAFLVTSDSCQGHMGVGADCTIAVRFTPTEVRGYVADVQIDVPANTLPPPVVLTGDGEPLTFDIFMDGFEP